MKFRVAELAWMLVPLTAWPGAAQGQSHPGFAFAGTGAYVLERPLSPTGGYRFTGLVLGGEGQGSWGPVVARAGYRQGRLTPYAGTTPPQDMVEAFVFVGAKPVPGLAILAGPFGRAYVTDSTRQRWLLWEVRAGYETAIAAPWLGAYGEVWSAVSGTVNVPEIWTGGRGGIAGVRVRHGQLLVGLGYAIEEGRFSSGPRRDTIEEVRLTVGVESAP